MVLQIYADRMRVFDPEEILAVGSAEVAKEIEAYVNERWRKWPQTEFRVVSLKVDESRKEEKGTWYLCTLLRNASLMDCHALVG